MSDAANNNSEPHQEQEQKKGGAKNNTKENEEIRAKWEVCVTKPFFFLILNSVVVN